MSSLESDEKASLEVLNSRDTVFLSQEICEKCHHKKGRRRSKSSDNVLKTRRGSGNIESIKLTSITSSPFRNLHSFSKCKVVKLSYSPPNSWHGAPGLRPGQGGDGDPQALHQAGDYEPLSVYHISLLLSGGRTPGQSTSVTALSQPWTSIAALSTIPK